MTISDNYEPIFQQGDGSTTQFSADWALLAAAYLQVFFQDVITGVQTQQLTGFTVAFTDAGLTVTFATAPPNTVYVVIGRSVTVDQSTPYTTSKGFQGAVEEDSYDKLTAICQDLLDVTNRSLKFQVGSTTVGTLPLPVDGAILAWDGSTGKLQNGPNLNSLSPGFGFITTSLTSNTIGTGNQTFTVGANLQFQTGQFVLATDAANSANYMFGNVVSYSGSTLVINSTSFGGSGTKTSWNISISAPQGATGATGANGTAAQAYFQYTSATVCTLVPFNGNKITFPTGATYTVPSAGVTLTYNNASINGTAGQTLAINTQYYVYLTAAGVLDVSTTAYAVDSGSGLVCKSSDNTRLLVGMLKTNGSSQFTDADGNRLVLSWFNKQTKRSRTAFSADRSTTSSNFVELNSDIRNTVMSWAAALVNYEITGSTQVSTSMAAGTGIGFNGTTPELETSNGTEQSPNQTIVIAVGGRKSGLTEGANYATALGRVTTGTGTWNSATASGTSAVVLNLATQG